MVRRTRAQPERQLQNSILFFLKLNKIDAWPVSSVGIFDPVRKRFRKSHSVFTRRGLADVEALVRVHPDVSFSVTVYLEMKSVTGKQSKDQREFEFMIKKNGGYYFIIRSIDQLKHAIAEVHSDFFAKWLFHPHLLKKDID